MIQLEQPLKLAWEQQWNEFWEICERLLADRDWDSTDGVEGNELERFRLSHALPDDSGLHAWFSAFHKMAPGSWDDFASASHLWPKNLPAPPKLANGLLEQLALYLDSDDDAARCYAQLVTFMALYAEATRAYQQRAALN